jgi:phage terminase small subunit
MVGKNELTTKQKKFAKAVAMGNTGADSYRQAYSTSGLKKTQGDQASRLKADPRIAAEIEAYKLANEAAAYRTAEQLRDLVIHSLTQVLINPDTNPAQRIQAAKVLGTVTEVAAFTERKEITNVTGSDALKAKIMAELNSLMMGSGSHDVEDVDAVSLLDELAADANQDSDEGTVGVAPQNENGSAPPLEHITPLEESTQESTPSVFK